MTPPTRPQLPGDPDPLNRAYEMLAKAELLGPAPRGIAMPFGVVEPDAWRWRVSPDVMQALYNAMPPPYPVPNPKSGDDGTCRLFGLEVTTDRTAPAGTMRLSPMTAPYEHLELTVPPDRLTRLRAQPRRRLGCWLPLALSLLAWAAIGWALGWWG